MINTFLANMGGIAKPDTTSPGAASTLPLGARKAGDARLLVVCALFVAVFTLFAGLGKLALMGPDEERNAEVAREMKKSGAWLIPTYNGLPYLDKPAFYFKTVALSFAMLGETNTAARLPSALFGFALLAMLFGFCRRTYNDRCAALAVLVVATSPLYAAFARLVIMDMALAFFVCAAIFAGFRAEEDEQRRARWYLLGAVAAGFATLVKGPVGFILPVLVLCVFNWLDRRRGAWKRLFAPLNVAVFFAIVLPWFLGVVHSYPNFAYYGIIEESLHRFATNEFHRTGPFYYYVPWIIIGCLAWSLLLPESIIAAWKARSHWSRADRLFVVWSVVLVAFFSISKSKRPDYILTVVVATGVLTARVFDLAFTSHERAARIVLRATAVLAVASAAAAAGLAVFAIKSGPIEHLLAVRNERFAWLTPVVLPVACGLFFVALVASIGRWHGRLKVALSAFLFFPLMVATVGFRGFELYAESKSNRALAQRLPELPADAEIVCLRCFPSGLLYYRKRLVTVLTNSGKEFTSNYTVFMLKETTAWPKGVVRLSECDRWLTTRDHPLYLIAREKGRDTVESVVAEHGAGFKKLAPGWWGALLPAASSR
jgi:Dolichyl-phosphate-mannose-protein mannosyltransferase